jgi:hypothetical protein
MERDYRNYETKMKTARAAHRDGMYRDAVKFALSAWEYIDGMMQYVRRYENQDFVTVEAIDMVLKYAPLLFDYVAIDSLQAMLTVQRRINRDSTGDMGDNLSKARALMWDAHRMWNHIEEHAETRQDELHTVLGGDESRWRSIAEAWEDMGLLQRTPALGSYRLAFITRLGEVVAAKCPSCGEVADAPKAMWLEHTACPRCRAAVLFVIRGKPNQAGAKE